MKLNTLLIRFSFFVLLYNTTAFSQSLIEWKKNAIYDDAGKASPMAIAVGDIDGDGFNDIVTGGSYSGLGWTRNLDGNGDFGSSKLITADASGSYGISDIAIADIDGDGFKDIVYVNTFAYWVRNLDGHGNFGTPINLSTTTFRTYSLQVIDIDNDGDLDIVHNRLTSYPSYYIELLKNNGNGTFAAPAVIAATSIVQRFIIADISGDNLADLVYETQSAVTYYKQNTDGTFTLTENMGSTSNHMSSGILNMGNVESGDIDNDGDLDIINVYQNGNSRSIRWFRNDNNVFANSQILITYNSDNGSASNDYFTIRVKDLDNDGKADIVIQNSFTNRIVWYKNLGNSTFGPQQIISDTVMQNKDVFIADINGDGNVDIATADYTQSVIKWFNNITGNASSFEEHSIDNFINIGSLHDVGDINGDGYKDVLLASLNTSKLSWYENTNGFGAFSNGQNNFATSLADISTSILADINSDGQNDIIATSVFDDNNKIVSFINSGQGNFYNEQLIYQSTAGVQKILTADIDNDADLDLIAIFGNGVVRIFKKNGNSFDAPISYTFGTANITKIEATDIDSDGDPDLLITNNSSLVWVENTDGTGNFSITHTINTPLGVPRNFVIGDINNDGLRDVVYSTTSNLGYMSINSNGTFGTQNTIGPISSGNTTVLKIADLDNDGDLDIVANSTVTFSTNSPLRFYENLGNSFAPFTLIGADQNLTKILISDINADGKLDIVGSTSTSEVYWYQNLGLNFNRIKGMVSLDLGLNQCTQGSISAQQVLVTAVGSDASVSTFSAPNGNFSFNVPEGSYTTSVTSSFPYFNPNPISVNSQFNTIDEESVANFCLTPTQFFNDLEISFYPLNDARPGFISEYLVIAKNKGTEPITTNVAIQYNGQKISFLNSGQAPLSQTSNSVVYNIENLLPFQSYTTSVKFQVNTIPTVAIGESIAFNIENNLPNDISAANNTFQYSQRIVGSYDPNDMKVLEGEQVHIDNSDDYLHYIIRFQNTGNHFAERVQVTTVLDQKLDWKTMELESFSHSNRVEIIDGSTVNFVFDAIYLPAITVNEADSNGYVAFKIKPKPTVAVDDTVNGQAAIYFDYNPAIVTNDVSTTFVSFLNVADQHANVISAYPNPVNSLLYLNNITGGYNAEIYNMLGVKVAAVSDSAFIDFTKHATGIYIVKITTTSGESQIFKVLKK